VALLKRTWKTEVTNIFDTQIAAGFAGYGAQSGYDSLVRSLLGETAKGAEGFSKWDRRPLTPEQIEYAAADVEHLLPMADALQDRLAQSGRLEWAREECIALEQATDERPAAELFARLPRVRRLGKRQRAVALALVEWRLDLARSIDRPPSSILPDHVMVEVARRQPTSRQALEEVRGMPGQTLQRWHRELVEAVERAADAPDAPDLPDIEQGDSSDAPLIALGQALVRQRAMEAKVAVDLVATQSDIAAVVGSLRRDNGEANVRSLQGWRRELVGNELVKLLSGECVVRVVDRRLSVEPGG
jgi:ribonuclease D